MQVAKFSDGPFNGVKVFSATMVGDRAALGDKMTEWLAQMRKREGFALREILVTQSSDSAYHCVALTAFFWEKASTRSNPSAR